MATPILQIGDHARLSLETGGLDAIRVRVPFGDEPLRESDVYRDSSFPVGVEIENRRLHAHSAPQAAFEVRILNVLDECRQVRRPRQWQPFGGSAILAGNRCECPPFMRRQMFVRRVSLPAEEKW